MKCITKLLLIVCLNLLQNLQFVYCIKKMDIKPYIDKMEERLENFATPAPEFVDEFLLQLQSSCKENVTMNPEMIPSFNTCMEDLFNVTSLVTEFRESIPKGDLDIVFRNLCLKWPNMKNCMKDATDFLSLCWGDNPINQLKIGMDTAVQFFCGNENDGAKIALFFAEDGLSCLEDHTEELSECLSEQIMESETAETFPGDICKAASNLYQCITIFKRCPNVTPENLIHSLVKHIGSELKCSIFPESSYVYPEAKVIPSSNELAEQKELKDSISRLIFENLIKGNMKNELGWLEDSTCKQDLIDATQGCSFRISDMSYLTKLQNIPFICKRFLEWTNECLEPHKELLKNCSTDGWIAISVIEDMCKMDNGTMLREILEHGEKNCKSKESAFQQFTECSKRHYEGKEPFLSLKGLSEDFCGSLSITRHCTLETLTKCHNHKSLSQVQTFLNKIDIESDGFDGEDGKVISKCLNKKSAFTSSGSGTMNFSLSCYYIIYAMIFRIALMH